MKDLHDFHTHRVKRYNDRLRHQAEQHYQQCIAAANQWTHNSAQQAASWEDSEWTEWSGNENHESEDTQPARRYY